VSKMRKQRSIPLVLCNLRWTCRYPKRKNN